MASQVGDARRIKPKSDHKRPFQLFSDALKMKSNHKAPLQEKPVSKKEFQQKSVCYIIEVQEKAVSKKEIQEKAVSQTGNWMQKLGPWSWT
ncbi:hypothetical protein V6N13_129484 [Hibiscus sabdariffa]|uniref:Uncharacterized protein n=1 Tax=Hibiscus sabdariffa TaxID=183260 RepID=A0ABR2SLB4_9ROSI